MRDSECLGCAGLGEGRGSGQSARLGLEDLEVVIEGEDFDVASDRAFVAGEGQAIVDGHTTKVSPNHMIVIPKGAQHNIVNKGSGPLKLFSVYAPPAEEPGVAHRTKADAEAAEEGFVSRAAKKLKEAVGQ